MRTNTLQSSILIMSIAGKNKAPTTNTNQLIPSFNPKNFDFQRFVA